MLTTALLLTGLTLFLRPYFLLRRIVPAVTRLIYRLTVTGRRHVPAQGGALLVANHVSWVDALLLMAAQRRRIRFVMDRGIYNTPLLRPLFRRLGVIPVSAKDGRQGLKEFILSSRQALDDGDLVCVFAEGQITRNGMLNAFKGGFERIVKGSGHPIIPVYIGGAWGSIFSYAHGRLLSRLPIRLPCPVTVAFGAPLPAGSSAQVVRQAVMELSCDWFNARKPGRRSLGERFVATARQNWRRSAIADTGGRHLSYGRALTAATAMAGKLADGTGEARMVGVCLPPTAAGALVNLALTLNGTVPVNLNYTASAEGIRSAVLSSGIRTTVTSRVFLEKLGALPELPGTIFIEDLLAGLSTFEKVRAFCIARWLPARFWARPKNFTADRLATVIFSSGSTGKPKGVMLSQVNWPTLSKKNSASAPWKATAPPSCRRSSPCRCPMWRSTASARSAPGTAASAGRYPVSPSGSSTPTASPPLGRAIPA